MPNISFDAAARAGANARAFVQQLMKERTAEAEAGSTGEGRTSSFGELLLQRQQALSGSTIGPQITTAPRIANLDFAGRQLGSTAAAPELSPVTQTIEPLPSTHAQAQQSRVGIASEGQVIQGPDGTTRTAFGHWEQRAATLRPFFWMAENQLDAEQREIFENWRRSPYNTVWVYDVKPSADNNWAGWGPPPRGWTTRSEIPMVDGAYAGSGLPWPPPGEPPAK